MYPKDFGSLMEKPCFLLLLLLLVIMFSVHHCLESSLATTVTSIDTDQSALFALKSHIFDPTNVLLKSWTNSTPVCTWFGVTCNARHKRVATLNISYMGLMGTIPPDLGNLSFLVSLDLTANNFHGDLPKELAHLRRLVNLSFAFNNFTGQIASWLGPFPRLQLLNLQNNSFSGNVPEEVGKLERLKVLFMDSNQLQGPIPFGMFNISSLEYISFKYNKLSGRLPTDVCRYLPELQYFSVSGNELEGQIARGLQECSKLQTLVLSINKFTGFIPREIGNLTKLEQLFLGLNNLAGGIPQELGNLVNLKILHLREANLTGVIPTHIGNCTSITVLNLSNNNLTGIIPEEISSLGNLEQLLINSNNLQGPIPAAIFNISTLKIISLVNNHFFGNLPPTMGNGLPNLELLYLNINELTGTIPNSITNATKLTEIDLYWNKLRGSIPLSLEKWALLQYLNFGRNNLTGQRPSIELSFLKSLTKCRHLQILWLSENPLNGYLPSSIGNLSTSLESFRARYCGIIGKIPNEIGYLNNLIFLDLGGNFLTGSLPTTLKALVNLQELHLYENSLHGHISDDLCYLQKLGSLHLERNKFSGPVPICIGNISSLRDLYLCFNELTSNLPASLWSLKDLLGLDMSSNLLTGSLPQEIGNLKAAVHINLSMNQFTKQIPSTVGSLENMINLSLAHNKFQGPIPKSIGKMIGLECLDLSHNDLSGTIPTSLEALSYLKYFNVSFNQLRGNVPSGGPFKNFTNMSFLSNDALCGAYWIQLPPCPDGSPQHSRRKRVLVVVLVSLGVALIMLVLTFSFVWLRCRRTNQPLAPTLMLNARTYGRIPHHELVQATNGFNDSNLLGRGSFSSVYKGILRDRTIVAVKVFNLQLEGSFKSFDRECEMLRNIRHRNLNKVISSCSNLDFKALILEYMPNGSLDKLLYSSNYFLDIQQRLDIMIDVASALDYLHHGYSTPVVHCDLKPSNILLDEDMVAHVSDFGIAKFLREGKNVVQTNTLATIGYTAPEYGQQGLVSTRCDVYSFGISLMEIFTRKKPTDEMFDQDMNLRSWVNQSVPNEVIHVMDTKLLSLQEEHLSAKIHCVSTILELALNCSSESPEERFNMKDVVASLKKTKLQFLSDLK